MTVTASGYVSAIQTLIDRIATTQVGNVSQAADHIVTALRAGGLLQAFGTGHSEAVAVDFAGRAGGLVPTNKILLRDLVVYGARTRRSSRTRSWNAIPGSPPSCTRSLRRVPRTCS